MTNERRARECAGESEGRRPSEHNDMAMLELYLIRHGIAAERGKDWPDDSKRPLTPAGISRLRKAARGLTALEIGFDQIVTSPLVRTRQTAEVFSEELKSKPPIATSDALAPAGTPAGGGPEVARDG